MAWLLEVLLFGLSLFIMLPAPASERGRAWDTPSRNTVLASLVIFFLSLLIATLSRRESLPGLIMKILIFGLFVFVLAEVTRQMGNSINNSIPDTLTK